MPRTSKPPQVAVQSPQSKKVRFNPQVQLIPAIVIEDELIQNNIESSVKVQLSFGGKSFESSSETVKTRKLLLTDIVQQMESGLPDENSLIDDSNPPQNTCFTSPPRQPTILDRDPKYFHLILFFLRNGETDFLNELTHYDLMELEKEAQYFQVETLLEVLSLKLSRDDDSRVVKKSKKLNFKTKTLRKTMKLMLQSFLNTPRNFGFEPKSRWVIWEPEKWMDYSDQAHGLRQCESCPSVFFAVSKLNVWDPSVYYSPPKGYHWATTKEFLKLVPSSFPEDTYYNKGGWKMCSWQGVTREAFLFLDTVFSHKWQHAGDCVGKLVHCKNLEWIRSVSNPDGSKWTFAGIVCIKDSV